MPERKGMSQDAEGQYSTFLTRQIEKQSLGESLYSLKEAIQMDQPVRVADVAARLKKKKGKKKGIAFH